MDAWTSVARLVRLVTGPRPLVTRLTRMHAAVVRLSRGQIRRSRVLGGGQPVLSLTTTGRRSGAPRSSVVAHLEDGAGWAVFGMNLGSEREPAWALNLAADPCATIHVGGRRLDVRARRARGAEEERLWRRYVDRLPAAAAFASIAGRPIPVFVLEPLGTAAPTGAGRGPHRR